MEVFHLKRISAIVAAFVFLAIFCGAGYAMPKERIYAGLTEVSAVDDSAPSRRVLASLHSQRVPETALFSLVLSVPAQDIPFDNSFEGRGPDSFSVADDGSVAILDSINKRICVYDSIGLSLSIDISVAASPIQIEQNSIAWFVLDSSGAVLRIDKSDRLIQTIETSCETADRLLLMQEGESVYLCSGTQPVYAIEGNLPTKPENHSVFEDSKTVLRYLGKDGKEGSYYLSYSLIDGPVVLGEYVITRCDRSGNPSGYAVLRQEEYDYCSRDSIFISENGDVFALAAMDGNVNVYSVILGKSYESHIDDLETLAEYICRGLSVPKRDISCERLSCGETISVISPVCIEFRVASHESPLYQRRFVPFYYEDPYCKIFFRVILQAPG